MPRDGAMCPVAIFCNPNVKANVIYLSIPLIKMMSSLKFSMIFTETNIYIVYFNSFRLHVLSKSACYVFAI